MKLKLQSRLFGGREGRELGFYFYIPKNVLCPERTYMLYCCLLRICNCCSICGRFETGTASVSPCPLCIVLWSSSVNANVCVSDSRPPFFQAYPSECSPFTQHSSRGSMGKWAGVGACNTLCGTPLGYYLFDKQGLWKVHVSFCVHMQLQK